jgi:diguanylate cyclase (GGDEF)-like protein
MNNTLERLSYAPDLGVYLVSKRIILIVGADRPEDFPLKPILQDEYQVVSALTGLEAIQIVKDLHPDLILCNIGISDIDKCALISELKAHSGDSRTPIIAIVNISDMDDIKNLVDCADDLIMEPILPDIVKMHISNHLELKQLRNGQHSTVMIDPLIGIPNRDYLEIMLEREWRRAMRHQSPQSLIIADIDFFKEFNECYGRSTGDKCLRNIAATISVCLKRDTDCVAHFQTNQFACLLAETDIMGAVQVAKKIIDAVEELDIPHKGSPIADHVTISMGVATLRPSSRVASEKLIIQAEELLAEAKLSGRNQIKSR